MMNTDRTVFLRPPVARTICKRDAPSLYLLIIAVHVMSITAVFQMGKHPVLLLAQFAQNDVRTDRFLLLSLSLSPLPIYQIIVLHEYNEPAEG
jgi:hypothetical protein